jgi:hypothetical protein
LWVVPGAHHVGARDIDPDLYFQRVESFLKQSLALKCHSEPSLRGEESRS